MGRGILVILLGLAALVGCAKSESTILGPDGTEPEAMIGASLESVAGDGQEGEVAATLSGPLVVRAVSNAGTPLVDAPVWWTFVQGAGRGADGTLGDSILVRTRSDGTASVEWTLGTRAGVQTAYAALPSSEATGATGPDGPSPAPAKDKGKKVGFRADGRPSTADSVLISPDETTLEEGESLQLSATILDAYGNVVEGSVKWSSSDPTVVEVTEGGVAYAGHSGAAAVTAKSGEVQDTASVTVAAAGPTNLPPSARIDRPAADTTITVGQSVDFQGTAHDDDGVVVSHVWSFGDGVALRLEDPGAYTYTGPGVYLVTYQVVDDDGAPGADSVEITVLSSDPAPTARNVVFHSDWGTTTGRTDAALYDTGKAKPWTLMLNNGNQLEVVANGAEGLDFPTSNVLKVHADNGGSGYVKAAQPQFRSTDNYIPIPAVGESLFYRYYLRLEVPDSYTADNNTHGTQDADNFSLRSWQHEIITRTNGTFDLRLSVTNGDASNPWPDHFWKVNLRKGVTYRIEQEIRRVSQSEFALHARVYDVRGGLLFDDDDFTNADGSSSLASGIVHGFGSDGAASLNAFRTGLNGLADQAGVFPFTFAYIGGMAICRGDWCGPYQSGM